MAVDSAEMPSAFGAGLQEDESPVMAYKRRMEDLGTQVALFGGNLGAKSDSDINAMVSANEMTARGATAAEAFAATAPKGEGQYKRTGWFRGEDNQWRFEIDDSTASLDKDLVAKLKDKETSKLSQILQHDEIFQHYSFLKDVNVVINNNSKYLASYNDDTKTIEINVKKHKNSDMVLDSILHETQHAIQVIEGFSSGSNPIAAGSVAAYLANKGETEARLVESRRNLSIAERKKQPPFRTNNDPIGNLIRSNIK